MTRLLVILLLCAAANARDLRIGVFGLFRPATVTITALPGEALLIETASQTTVLEPGRTAAFHAPAKATSRTRQAVSALLRIPGKIERRFHGTFQSLPGPGGIVIVVTMDSEQAVASVVAAELPEDAPLEARKAMAIAARSYYLASPRHHGPFEFCDTTHCQFLRAPPGPQHPAHQAAMATGGMILIYRDEQFRPLYSASCGGRSRTAAEVGFGPDPYPYFGVDCAACARRARVWHRELPAAIAGLLLRSPDERTRLQVTKLLGSGTLPGNHYQASLENEKIIINGRGEGHGVGLCQMGAIAMARAGANYLAIMRYYFQNTKFTIAE